MSQYQYNKLHLWLPRWRFVLCILFATSLDTCLFTYIKCVNRFKNFNFEIDVSIVFISDFMGVFFLFDILKAISSKFLWILEVWKCAHCPGNNMHGRTQFRRLFSISTNNYCAIDHCTKYSYMKLLTSIISLIIYLHRYMEVSNQENKLISRWSIVSEQFLVKTIYFGRWSQILQDDFHILPKILIRRSKVWLLPLMNRKNIGIIYWPPSSKNKGYRIV